MYAVIQNGNRQYRVSPGDVIGVEKLPVREGENVTLENVLMLADGDATVFGSPFVRGAKVIAEVVEQRRKPKILVYKQRPRKGYRTLRGHRQPFTVLKIREIVAGG